MNLALLVVHLPNLLLVQVLSLMAGHSQGPSLGRVLDQQSGQHFCRAMCEPCPTHLPWQVSLQPNPFTTLPCLVTQFFTSTYKAELRRFPTPCNPQLLPHRCSQGRSAALSLSHDVVVVRQFLHNTSCQSLTNQEPLFSSGFAISRPIRSRSLLVSSNNTSY